MYEKYYAGLPYMEGYVVLNMSSAKETRALCMHTMALVLPECAECKTYKTRNPFSVYCG